MLTGMAYTVWWATLVRHRSFYWVVPGDIWGTVRAAHWIGWGGLSFIYSSKTGLVTLPGFHVLLAPIVALASHLGLSESAPGILPPVPKPTAWLLIGPFLLACGALPLFAADALARRLGASRWARRALAFGTAAAVWPTIAMWGHAEDVLALGLALYAVVALSNRRLGAAGWLLGGAVAMQLYAVALIPLFVAVVGRRKVAPLLARIAILPGFLLVAVIVPNFDATVHALFDQPNFPTVDHATPWLLLAPKLGHGAVAAGPGRVIGLLIAVVVGALGMRHRSDARYIVWLGAVVLGLRCVFESVMDPYYVMPVIVLALVVASQRSVIRFAGTVAGGAGLTVLTYFRPDMWAYWSEMTGVMVVMLALAWPGTLRRSAREGPDVDAFDQPPYEAPSTVAVSA
ncbi:MAG TPA: hypothetical protein VMV22_12705 [Acidimicrobiales bacterium]|nr:hypothetical protein [Acidimicrobiales bacterium]